MMKYKRAINRSETNWNQVRTSSEANMDACRPVVWFHEKTQTRREFVERGEL
jgi:hypothetical protein